MPRCLAFSAVLVAATVMAAAQCPTSWLPGAPALGISSVGASPEITAVASWDPDGLGPLPARLVATGVTSAGGVPVDGLAMLDPATGAWTSLGTGFLGAQVLLATPSGELFVGGSITNAGGTPVGGIARWNGASWQSLGSGLDGGVLTMAMAPNGDLIVGGAFTTAGGVPARNIARWNGTTWSALGGGLFTPSTPFTFVTGVTVLPNGDVIAVGWFSSSGTATIHSIARWNGSAWSAMGGTPMLPGPSAVTLLANGDIVVGGSFSSFAGVGANSLARWNGTTWSSMGFLTGAVVRALLPVSNGDLLVGGAFANFAGGSHVARWSSGTWSSLGAGVAGSNQPFVAGLALLPNGDLAAVGRFDSAGGAIGTAGIARWNGAAWSSFITNGTDGDVRALASTSDGGCVVAGTVRMVSGTLATRVAKWDGAVWSALGAGVGGTNTLTAADAVLALPNGDIVVGGNFTDASGVPANGIARWDGATWSSFGSGVAGLFAARVYAIVRLPNGDLIVGGQFDTAGGVTANGIARWNGASWSGLGSGVGTVLGGVFAVLPLPTGDIVVGGAFDHIGGVAAQSIAQWNGAVWSPLGAGLNSAVRCLTLAPNGDVVAGGNFTASGAQTLSRVARWNGASWSPLGPGVDNQVYALTTLPSGDLVAGGDFANAGVVPARRIARWNGSTWSPFGSGMSGPPSQVGRVMALGVRQNGELLVGGEFDTAGGLASGRFARHVTSCPATATVGASGCPSSGGANTLVATTLPWSSSDFRTRGTGLPTNAIVVVVTGFGAFAPGLLPLASVFPEGGLGCDLLVPPDILQLSIASNGVAESGFFIVPSPPIAGVTFDQQMLPFEFDAQGVLVSITATNSVRLTGGIF